MELLSNDDSSAVSNRGGARSADSSASSASSCGSGVQPPPSSSEEMRTQATANFQHIFGGPQPCSHDQRGVDEQEAGIVERVPREP